MRLLNIFCFFLTVSSHAQNIAQDSLTLPQEAQGVSSYNEEPKLAGYLSREWELDSGMKRGTFKLIPYQPNYVMPLRWTDNFNRQPFNENPNMGQPEYKNYQNVEAMFQISLKSKFIQGAFWGKGDFWFGYTQKAYWQVYNGELSRPFREMNYEPEIMFVMPLNMSAGDLKWRLFSVSINHQSNGKEQVLSRSWNRLIFVTAFEWRDFIFTIKNFHRFREKNDVDENPNIEKYIGRWEFALGYNAGGGHTFMVSTRNNMNFNRNRNYITGNYVFPISGYMKGILQVTHGYGDSLIEYNHKQTNIGIGFMFLEL